MKQFLIIIFISFSWSCKKSPERFIEHLDGYWEIEEVTLPDGTKREYSYNNTIDFLTVSDSLTGFRKKLTPKLDGTFSTSEDKETMEVILENDSLNIYYKTPYSAWKETVLEATRDQLILENQKGMRYTYKKYEPLKIE